jgi:glycosyltransferase involved in cell wall biosynthesis
MADPVSAAPRASVDGKFFRLGREKFHPKGVTYGPFAPDARGDHFGSPEQAARDFGQIRTLGANLLRVYFVPPGWFLDLAAAHGLRLLIDIPWNKHVCFLDAQVTREAARQAVHAAAVACARHPAVFALSVVNEIPADIVRWSGAAAVESFIDELAGVVKHVDPECLCTFGNYPPTEFLRPKETDFVCFNVYLHQPEAFRNYLARLQMLAESRPLVLGEIGLDSLREGEDLQGELLERKIEVAFRGGLAGVVVYSFTDEWFKDGRLIEDWCFGLTEATRAPKPAFFAVQRAFALAPRFPLARQPMISVVVACFNGERTLRPCLEALTRLNYRACEVILVDDGSTDRSPQIAAGFPTVRYVRHENLGLSTARDTGIAAARGEIVAFTDADCRPDEDWLYYLANDLLQGGFAGIGGPNLLPPEDSCVAAAVLVSPGGPAHVMLSDRVAEHIPGCNMGFWKWALLEIGCFDPVFRRAGDDVDVCWRLQQRGYELGFSPAGFVWHYRRSTIRDYLKQQQGYGEAEALLERKHPEYFNPLGGSIWRGRIYAPAHAGVVTRRPMIYHGAFGLGLFQSLYTATSSLTLLMVTSLEYHVVVTLPLLVLAAMFRWLIPVAFASLVLSASMCVAAGSQAEIPPKKRRLWSRPLVALLFALQPIVRGWARYQGRLLPRLPSLAHQGSLPPQAVAQRGPPPSELQYWAAPGFQRRDLLEHVLGRLERKGWHHRPDAGWSNFDVEIFGSRWTRLQLSTVGEFSQDGQQLVRCRLRASWTLPARAIFWSFFGLVLLVMGLAGLEKPWYWLLLLPLPAYAGWLQGQQRTFQRIVAVFLDEIAATLGLRKLALPSTTPIEARAASPLVAAPACEVSDSRPAAP